MRRSQCLVATIFFFSVLTSVTAQERLAIIGSSTSACYNATVFDSCYVGRLYDYYNQEEPKDTAVDNGYAVPGYSCLRGMPTSFVSPYSDPDLQPDPDKNITAALATHPDVIIVNYPTNSYDTLAIDTILYCLRTIRDSANQAGVPCFVTTTQPRSTFPMAARIKLKELRDSIMLEMGFFAIDFWDGLADPVDYTILPAFNSGDGVHFNNAGHNKLFQRVVAKNIFNSTLPATFLEFNTIYKNNATVISWLTARETDVAYYEIERSADGKNFSRIATVTAANSNGNHTYQFTDAQVLKGWDYYKIAIVDKDGNKHASPVMTVYISTGRLSIVKTFAHAASQVVVQVQNNEPQNATICIMDNTGRVMAKVNRLIDVGNTSCFIDTPALSNGVYRVVLITAKESLVGSFIKN